jgi:hypothetical protein
MEPERYYYICGFARSLCGYLIIPVGCFQAIGVLSGPLDSAPQVYLTCAMFYNIDFDELKIGAFRAPTVAECNRQVYSP